MSRRLLIVDDEETIRWALRELLIGEGFEVHLAADGRQAAALLERMDFDLLITDLKMPGRSGVEVIREARRQNPNTGIIVLTGYASVDTAVEALRLRAWYYLIKPCEASVLCERVRAFFQAADADAAPPLARPTLPDEAVASFLEGRGTSLWAAGPDDSTGPRGAAGLLCAVRDALTDLGLDARRVEQVLQGCVEAVAGIASKARGCRVGLLDGHLFVALRAEGALPAAARHALTRVTDLFGLDLRLVEHRGPAALVLCEAL